MDRIHVALVVAVVVQLAGCASTQNIGRDQARGCGVITSLSGGCDAKIAAEESMDDMTCRGYGAQPGTDAYIGCRTQLGVARRQREATARAAAVESNRSDSPRMC